MASTQGQQSGNNASSNGQHSIAQQLVALQTKKRQPPISPQPIPYVVQRQRKKWSTWTGFSGKTLWDWLQLLAALAIPIVVAFVSISFSIQQDANNKLQHATEMPYQMLCNGA